MAISLSNMGLVLPSTPLSASTRSPFPADPGRGITTSSGLALRLLQGQKESPQPLAALVIDAAAAGGEAAAVALIRGAHRTVVWSLDGVCSFAAARLSLDGTAYLCVTPALRAVSVRTHVTH